LNEEPAHEEESEAIATEHEKASSDKEEIVLDSEFEKKV